MLGESEIESWESKYRGAPVWVKKVIAVVYGPSSKELSTTPTGSFYAEAIEKLTDKTFFNFYEVERYGLQHTPVIYIKKALII